MTETSTTNNTVGHSAGVLAHGLRAVARHLVEHHLPAPIEITANRNWDHVQVHVASVDQDAWVESIVVDTVVTSDIKDHGSGPSVRTQHLGRVGLGVRVDVLSVAFAKDEVTV